MKNNLKKLWMSAIAIVFVLPMMFVLVACGGGNNNPSGQQEARYAWTGLSMGAVTVDLANWRALVETAELIANVDISEFISEEIEALLDEHWAALLGTSSIVVSGNELQLRSGFNAFVRAFEDIIAVASDIVVMENVEFPVDGRWEWIDETQPWLGEQFVYDTTTTLEVVTLADVIFGLKHEDEVVIFGVFGYRYPGKVTGELISEILGWIPSFEMAFIFEFQQVGNELVLLNTQGQQINFGELFDLADLDADFSFTRVSNNIHFNVSIENVAFSLVFSRV